MTSDVAFPDRLTEIDELTRPDHSWLTADDRCYFLGEYTARQGYAYSPTNDLILNFKKPPDRQGRPEWRYKELAIQRAATAFRLALGAAPPARRPLTLPVRSPSGRLSRSMRRWYAQSSADTARVIAPEHGVVAGPGGSVFRRSSRRPCWRRAAGPGFTRPRHLTRRPA